MRFDARTVFASLGVLVLVVASAVFAVRAGHSTAGPAGRFDGAEDVDAPEPDDFLIEVLRATGDSTRIEVTLRVQGREDLGPVDLMPVFLVGDRSRTLASGRGEPDPADSRIVSFVFTGLSEGGPWRITGDSLRMSLNGRAVSVRHEFDINVPAIDTTADRILDVQNPVQPLGTAKAVVDQAIVTPSSVVIRGHFAGLDSRLVPGLHPEPSMRDSSGQGIRITGGRSGYGEGNLSFEFRFPPIAAGPAQFEIGLEAQNNPSTREFDSALKAQLASLDGVRAEWTIVLP